MATVLDVEFTRSDADRLNIRYVATQFPMSLDAGATLWAARTFAHKNYPGAQSAKLVFWEGGKTPGGHPAEEWEKKGYMLINCGGGHLDHHPHNEHPGHCSFTKLLEKIGLLGDPRFGLLKKYIVWDDTRETKRPDYFDPAYPGKEETAFAFARMFKDAQYGFVPTGDPTEDQARMREIALKALTHLNWALKVHTESQDRIHRLGGQAYNAAQKAVVISNCEKARRFVAGVTDCNEFGVFARMQRSFRPDVVVQKKHLLAKPAEGDWPSHVQIMGSQPTDLNFAPLAVAIRREEMRYTGKPSSQLSDEELSHEGIFELAPQWYFMPAKNDDGASMLLNGSIRHRDILPTAIPFGRIVRLVQDFLEQHG